MVDRDFGNWLAGFIDGEGCFYITKDRTRSPWRARFSLALRADDRDIVENCQRVTGIGTIHEYRGQSGNSVVRWMVQSRDDTEKLVSLLRLYPLRAKKRLDFEIWARAVPLARSVKTGRGADNRNVNEQMVALKEELTATRKVGP